MDCMDGITGTETHDGWKAKPAVVADGMKETAKYSCKNVLALVC